MFCTMKEEELGVSKGNPVGEARGRGRKRCQGVVNLWTPWGEDVMEISWCGWPKNI